MPRTTIDGVDLAHDDAGRGTPPLLLVHGWGGTRRDLAPQAAHFAAAHRVVAVDRRGHGESGASRGDDSVQRQADDLAALSRDLGLDRAVVVQHSYDRIGVDYAARYPDMVLGLCLLDTPTLAPGFVDSGREFLAGLESDGWAAAIRGFADAMVFPAGMPAGARDAAVGEILRTPRSVLVSSWRAFIEYPLADMLPLVRCPLLHVAGAFPSDMDRLRTLCPQLQTAEVRGAGHFIQLTAPDAVNGILAGFVDRVMARA